MLDRKSIGRAGEELATRFLLRRGYTILCRNFRIGRSCEIDIVARDGRTVCFIEVKSRNNSRYGEPRESVTLEKQRKIRSAAGLYISTRSLNENDYRFDVIEVFLSTGEIRHVNNAF